MIKGKKGFTLAEVLITLGIIGVVAAMTIPNLMNNYTQKRNINTWKKAYAEFTQLAKQISYDYEVDTFEEAVRMQEELDNLTPQANVVTQPVINLFNRYFQNTNTACNGNCKYGSQYKNGWNCQGILVDKYVGGKTGYKYLNGADAGYWVLGYSPTVCIQTPSYTFALDTNTSLYGRISIDVNGKNAPNTIGKDIFVLNMNKLNEVIPGGTRNFYTSEDYACNEKAKYGGPACSKKYLE